MNDDQIVKYLRAAIALLSVSAVSSLLAIALILN